MAQFGPPDIEKLAAQKNLKGLIKALDYNRGDWVEEKAVRHAAVCALGELKDPRAAAALVKNLAYFYRISQRGEYSYQGYLFDPETFVVSDVLVGIGQPAAEPLMAALELEHQSRETRNRFSKEAFLIAVTLGKIGVQLGDPGMCVLAFEVYLREKYLAQYETSSIMETLNEKLTELAEPAMELLFEALRKQDPRSESILELLELLKDPRAVEPLIILLQGSSEGGLRLKAVNVLKILKDSRAHEPLIAALNDESKLVREAAIEALGVLQDPDLVKPLTAMLKDSEAPVREAAVQALRKLKVNAVDEFIAALKDTEAYVRTAAIEALADLGDTRAVEPLLGNLAAPGWEERKLTAEALLQFYQREDINAQIRKKILARRKLIVEPHYSHVNCDTFNHTDVGIGLDFPL
ncbi:MAG: HEAT repeat domain-containing protein [Anaerolineales bacterium]|nr:HEAT repeat domain-containing protein [Anaerolineales bacterium]